MNLIWLEFLVNGVINACYTFNVVVAIYFYYLGLIRSGELKFVKNVTNISLTGFKF